MSVEADLVYKYSGYGRHVGIARRVWQTWYEYRQTEPADPEACGVLIGWTSADRRELFIDTVTEPKAQDRRSRYRFELMDPGHQRAVDKAYIESDQTMIYLGTWHSHPVSNPVPSDIDKGDWRLCLERNERRPLLFIIVGTQQTQIYIPWGHHFRSLTFETDT